MPSPEEIAKAGETGANTPGAVPAAEVTPAAESATAVPSRPAPQTVPFERFTAVNAQKAEREAQLAQARRELELANATIEEFKKLSEGLKEAGVAPVAQSTPAVVAATPRPPSQQEIEQLVAQEAARRDFTRQCNEAFQAGKAAHADFEKVLADLNALSPIFDPRYQRPVMPQSVVEAALATGQAHEVLYALGKDNALADRVFSLSPLQQAAALTKLAVKLEAEAGEAAAAAGEAEPAASVSKAPPPVKPRVAGSGSSTPVWDPAATDKFSTAEWIAKREADVKRQREATRH